MLGANLGNFSKARDLGPWVANQFMGVTTAHFARSDDHDVDPVVGGSVSFGRPNARGEDEGGGTEGGLLEEISAVGHMEFLTGREDLIFAFNRNRNLSRGQGKSVAG